MPNGYIVLINGQSNSWANGTGGAAYPSWAWSSKIQLWCPSTGQILNYMPTFMPGFPNWGPEASYCALRHITRPDDDLFIIKRADGAIASMAPTGPRWQPWLSDIVSAIAVIRAMGFTPVVDVLLLVGGETDAQTWPDLTSLLRYNTRAIFDSLRIALNAPDMRMIVSRIYPYWDYSGMARGMQETAGSWPNCAWVDVDDVTKADPGHANVDGIIEAGRRLWEADRHLPGLP